MNSYYIIKLGAVPAIADLDNHSGVWEIRRINVPEQYRGAGVGSALLDMVLADADKEKAVLRLDVYASGPLDNAALTAWYERRGFVTKTKTFTTHSQASFTASYMERQPKESA